MEQCERLISPTCGFWNRGRLIGPKPPLNPRHIWEIRMRLKLAGRVRDLALFDLAIDSKLRGCDLVKLRSDDVVLNGAVKSPSTVQQRKTRRPVHFEISEQARTSLAQWLERRGTDEGFLFQSRLDGSRPISTRQYSMLVRRWVGLIGLDPSAYGTHSLRRTKASLIYKKTGNLRAIQLLLGHTKIESTVRYSVSKSMMRCQFQHRLRSELPHQLRRRPWRTRRRNLTRSGQTKRACGASNRSYDK